MDARVTVVLKGGILYCDDAMLDLRKRPLAAKLFELFLRSPAMSVTKDQVVEEVYGHLSPCGRTRRFSEALRHNAIKLVSRCRAMAELTFNGDSIRWIDWFVYDVDSQSWTLYRLRSMPKKSDFDDPSAYLRAA